MLATRGTFLKCSSNATIKPPHLCCLPIGLCTWQTAASHTERNWVKAFKNMNTQKLVIVPPLIICRDYYGNKSLHKHLIFAGQKEMSLHTMPTMAKFADEIFLHAVNTKHQTIKFMALTHH